ncbi:hypothetical protein GALLN_00546 [Gallionellaceae bacterium]|nr:hypothetical protein GALLN_00546 [Gallionellaceae bacterium]
MSAYRNPTLFAAKGKIMSSIWRSILAFIVIVLVLGLLGVVFYPAH